MLNKAKSLLIALIMALLNISCSLVEKDVEPDIPEKEKYEVHVYSNKSTFKININQKGWQYFGNKERQDVYLFKGQGTLDKLEFDRLSGDFTSITIITKEGKIELPNTQRL